MPSASALMGLRTRVKTIKYNRDYSFLLSEDAEIPLPPPPQPSYSQPRNKFPSKSQVAGTAKLPVRGLALEGRTFAGTGQKNVGIPAAARAGESAMKKPVVTSKWHDLQGRQELSNRKPTPKSALQNTGVPSRFHIPPASKLPLSRKGEIQEPRKSTASSNLTLKSAQKDPGVPSRFHLPVSKQPLSRKGEIQELRKLTAVSRMTPKSAEKKPGIPSRLHPPIPEQPLSRKGGNQETRKPTTAASSFRPKSAMQITKDEISQKQQVPRLSSNPKITHAQPPAKSSVRAKAVEDHQPKKRPRSHDQEELDYAISEIRKMFGYNPNKYVDDYDDDRNMVANFEEIQREEKRSARIAGKEDREELRKMQEEESRGRLQKNAKKRKIEGEVQKAYKDLGLDDNDD